ncbi:hypothetical protein RF11_06248 [Thelohanellus kitauei]|uniref:Uncharacterized protein n=1 Tax=Thelohanellus kitauei TaxID=669202 RepID=A0A0C2M9P3_THEKT|nr:hypothetical protein RF11_06248 [Thelohanellus kitauei]
MNPFPLVTLTNVNLAPLRRFRKSAPLCSSLYLGWCAIILAHLESDHSRVQLQSHLAFEIPPGCKLNFNEQESRFRSLISASVATVLKCQLRPARPELLQLQVDNWWLYCSYEELRRVSKYAEGMCAIKICSGACGLIIFAREDYSHSHFCVRRLRKACFQRTSHPLDSEKRKKDHRSRDHEVSLCLKMSIMDQLRQKGTGRCLPV